MSNRGEPLPQQIRAEILVTLGGALKRLAWWWCGYFLLVVVVVVVVVFLVASQG